MIYVNAAPVAENDDSAGRLSERIRNLIGTLSLDCECRQRVDDALQRFVAQEQDRQDRRHLTDARRHRASIAALLDLLGELEDVSWREGDRSVFGELAHIFDDIGRLACQGSIAMQLISHDRHLA